MHVRQCAHLNKMYYRTFLSKYGLAIAVADKELIGKRLKFKDTEFHVNPRFYKDKEGDKETIIELLKEAVNINLVGKKAVECGKVAGMIDEENIILIDGVPHAQAIKIVL